MYIRGNNYLIKLKSDTCGKAEVGHVHEFIYKLDSDWFKASQLGKIKIIKKKRFLYVPAIKYIG